MIELAFWLPFDLILVFESLTWLTFGLTFGVVLEVVFGSGLDG